MMIDMSFAQIGVEVLAKGLEWSRIGNSFKIISPEVWFFCEYTYLYGLIYSGTSLHASNTLFQRN